MADMVAIEHGTSRGYRQHQATLTGPCEPCREANRLAVWASRVRNDKVNALTIPLDVLADVLTGEADALARYLGADVVKAFADRSRAGRAA